MGDAAAVAGALHILFVDMVGRQVASYAGEEIDVALTDCLTERYAVTNIHVETAHLVPPAVLHLRETVGGCPGGWNPLGVIYQSNIGVLTPHFRLVIPQS